MLPHMSEPPEASVPSEASELQEAPEPPGPAESPAPGEPFDPAAVLADRDQGRTPVGFIVGMAIAAACAFAAVGIDAVQSFAFGDGPAPFAIALPLALLPVPLLISLVLWMDRLEPEPRQNLAFAFVWGAGIAALAALIINTADLEYVTMPALGASTGEYVAATFGAPVVEETMKGLVLFGLLWRRRDEIDGPTDGVIYAAMVGLGFAMVENVGYYINAIVSPERGGIALLGYTFVLRGVVSPLLHPIFTSMTGLGVAYAASRPRGAWNGLSLFGTAGLIGGYLIMSAVLAGLIVVLYRDRRRLVGLILRYLPGYAYTGLVTGDDVAMLASLRARAQARTWARAAGGLPATAAMGDYQLAATELALARAKSVRGVLTPVHFATRERNLLDLMAVARHSFTRRIPLRADAPAPWAAAGSALIPGDAS
jgi:RsiW-degrading membrane proteinase PrsW (M82 family)